MASRSSWFLVPSLTILNIGHWVIARRAEIDTNDIFTLRSSQGRIFIKHKRLSIVQILVPEEGKNFLTVALLQFALFLLALGSLVGLHANCAILCKMN